MAAGSRCWSAAVAFTLLTTWATGRRLMRERLAEDAMPIDDVHQVRRAAR